MSQTVRTGARSTLTLPSDLEIRIERAFDAPRDRVWRFWTDARLFPQWLGPAQYRMTTSEMDARTGGTYRWVWDVDGAELVIRGDLLEVDAPARLVAREVMEPYPGHAINLIVFTENDGRTTVAVHITFGNTEARDAALASGMQDGMDLGYARLDDLLARDD